MGLEGLDLVGSETTTGFTSLGSDPQTNPNWYGSGFFKQDRACNNEDEYRSSKLAKNDELSGCKPLMYQQRNALLRSNTSLFFDEQEERQMLSFSAPKSDAVSVDRNSKNLTFPHFHLTGYNSGGFDDANMHGGYKGPFTPCQWMELEHQALIYKYIISNVPIPSNLLIPIRKSLVSADFSSFSGGLLRPNTSTGWRAFQLGFSNNTDPEPGRCRRTDGKKWRCSRDAVTNHKYCERHMNRGRNRSRKPVEGQSSHSVAATSTTTTKLMPNVSSSSASVVGPVCGSNKSNSLTLARQQFENLQPGDASNLSAADPLNRLILNKGTVGENIPQNGHLKSKENPFLNPKQPLNPSHKSSSSIECRNFGSSHDLTSQETESQHSFRRFIDDRPKSLSNCSAISWPELDVQSYRTQLSISIPMAASDFMSTTSSPNTKNLTPPPLRLSREFNPIHIGLGVDNVTNESNQRQIHCTPVSWDTSMGGPLGEALHSSSSNTMVGFKNSSVLNLMTEGSEYSPRIGSSPTGVLQKTTYGSLSNSSAGSSPRTENNKTREGFTHCNDILGSTPVES
ncbi:growth-regulating factor 1 [Hibiscus trionum]|uniref:Growth-regulating factor n=1 Tax=Hibiscus trionum TaxID=183268 RepID=A0A9W7I635_HIBTR|nr:growth-regulating factor 1 [Hibiscus trionum]